MPLMLRGENSATRQSTAPWLLKVKDDGARTKMQKTAWSALSFVRLQYLVA
jgi:hypothetical protein